MRRRITAQGQRRRRLQGQQQHLSSSNPMLLSASRHHLGISSPYLARTCVTSYSGLKAQEEGGVNDAPITFLPPPTVKRKPNGLAAGIGSVNARVMS